MQESVAGRTAANTAAYTVVRSDVDAAYHLYQVGFGRPATNAEIVVDALDAVSRARNNEGGTLALVSGPSSMPAAFVLAHALSHAYGAVGVYDPKMGAYVVSVTHDPNYRIGQVIKL